jgi:ribosome-binding protein aMBF1 (putative translation factor)
METDVRSFHHQPDNRRALYLQLAGSIESQLRESYARKHEKEGLTQSDIATRLGVGRSVINRRLSGGSNMTIETIADMAWALGHCIRVDIFDPSDTPSNGAEIIPDSDQANPFKVQTVATAMGPASILVNRRVFEHA